MKVGDLVKPAGFGLWTMQDYGIGLVLAVDDIGSVKVYWPINNFWCITTTKNVAKI
tara:strand:+ start:251 stop:418 length:168 start_codon:yes stop_codon:yes gene_type:complete